MAQKDFIKGLQRKEVPEETIELVKDHYSNQTDLGKASVKDLVDIGLSEESANVLLTKLGKKKESVAKKRSPARKKAEKEA
ncbi:MAG: hypothetical protein MIO87_03270, partial [Methanomassiliicoccales archaeon]|nr:hypothetical protein [Methanomassiliicoccales archaeon]